MPPSLSPTRMPAQESFSTEEIQLYLELVTTLQSVSQDGSGDDVKKFYQEPRS